MKKKVAVLLVNNGFGEVDWILPVLDKLSKNYTIFTYFRSQSAFNSLKTVNEIFYLWKKISKGYYVEKKFDNFFWKSLRKVINTIYKKNVKINSFINKKIHDINFIENKIFNILGLKNFKISIFFSEFGVYSGWVEIIKNNFKRPLIVHFPSHSSIFNKKLSEDQFRKVRVLSGDLLLISAERDISRFANFISAKKIFVVGVPKFDNWWINKVLNSKLDFDKKKLRNKSVISIGIRPKFQFLEGKDFIRLENQIHDIMKVLCEIKNILIIIKIHPKTNPPEFFKILENYNNKKWTLSKNHLMRLSKISNCTINSINSAVPLDALCVNKPAIELWPVRKNETNKFNEQKKLGITIQAKNRKNFSRLIKLVLNKPDHPIWIAQKKSFMDIYKCKNYVTLKVINILNKSLRKMKNSR